MAHYVHEPRRGGDADGEGGDAGDLRGGPSDDAGGRIASTTETVNGVPTTLGYVYDTAGRLTRVTRDGVLAYDYGYDGSSNRVNSRAATRTK